MKRSIPRSLISKAMAPATEPAEKEETDAPAPVPTPAAFRGASAGAGSAWKSGALAQSQATLERNREQLIEDILSGRHELALSPDQISDPLGTDRRSDWVEQEAFATLVRSIEENGQDTPILVWPEDPEWRPDPLDPTNAEGVRFIMLTGRRRHAAAEKLGRKLRVILGPAEARKKADNRFEMLFLRFRENEERENLSPFERLLSIGEMYETLRASEEKITAVAFAGRIGVHESIVSRARTVFGARDEILKAFKNVYEMSFRDLQAALATLADKPKAKAKAAPKKLQVKRKIGSRNLSVTSVNGTLSVKAAGIKMDQQRLEGLGDLIAAYLAKQETGEDPQ